MEDVPAESSSLRLAREGARHRAPSGLRRSRPLLDPQVASVEAVERTRVSQMPDPLLAMTVDATDALDLLDWKRQIFALYESVRSNSDPRSAWRHWLETRDRAFVSIRSRLCRSSGVRLFSDATAFDYDPSARVVARVETRPSPMRDVASSTGAALPFSECRTAHFVYAGDERSLLHHWNEGYGEASSSRSRTRRAGERRTRLPVTSSTP